MTSRRRIGVVAGAVAVVVVSVCVVISVVSFAVWREWPWSSYPSQLHYCGRDYLGPGVANSPSEVAARGAHKVGDVPNWFNGGEVWAVYAPGQAVESCGTEVWVRSTSGGFRAYGLSGGP